jgi:hypothetical protein
MMNASTDALLPDVISGEEDDLELEPLDVQSDMPMVYTTGSIALASCGVFLLLYTARSPTTPGGHTGSTKLVLSANMMNQSAQPCENIYTYACGTYNSRYTDSSLFSETQLGVLHDTEFGVGVDTNVTLTGSLDPAGLYADVGLSVYPSVGDTSTMALYMYPLREDNPTPDNVVWELVHPTANRSFLSASVQSMLMLAWSSRRAVYWGSDEDKPLQTWALNISRVNVTSQYNDIASSSLFDLLTTYYNVTSPSTPNTDVLVSNVRAQLVSYVESDVSFIETSDAREAYVRRVQTIDVYVGHGDNILQPACVLGTPLYTCLVARWSASTDHLLRGTTPNTSVLWPISGVVVNAVFSSLVDAVYIAAAITQPPFFDPSWPMWMQMATLGSVISHEIGHAIRAGVSSDSDARDAFDQCIVEDEVSSGSTRSALTLEEDWADTIAFGSLMANRNIPDKRVAIVMYVQTWCAAGHPKYAPLSTDPHATSYLRGNVTVETDKHFYEAFGCTDIARAC